MIAAKLGILLFGAIMIAVSVAMIVRPEAWGHTVIRFSRLRYMHPFEILTRIGFGILFVVYADDSKFPIVIRLVGWILLAAGLGLLVISPSYHRRLALWSVEKFSRYFRHAGLASFAFGAFLIYAAI